MDDHSSFTIVEEDVVYFKGEKSYFSSFYHSPIIDVRSGNEFPTVEHYYQFQKAQFFHDIEASQKIVKATTPHDAKKIGHTVKNFDEKKWEKEKFSVMYNGLALKFSIPEMDAALKEFYHNPPYNRRFVQISSSRFWGCNAGIMTDNNNDNSEKYGENMMGKLITGFAQLP